MDARDLRELLRFAAVGGADAQWLERTAAAMLERDLEVRELRRCVDPRKRQTLRLAAQISQADRTMRAARTPNRVASLCARFRVRRSRIYELLALAESGEISDT